jgi:glycosyltransferase involved in cell wall biosynthesis
MINIAFVHSVAKIGGAERVSQMLMLGLDKQAFSCTLICPDLGELCDWATEHAIPSHQLPLEQPGLSNAFATIKQSVEWIRWFNTNQIDIVHTADPYCTRAISIAAAMSGVKVLSHFHFPFERKQLSWLLKRLPKPDICVFCSEDLQQEVGAHLQSIVPNIPMRTIHNGVDITRFKPTKNIKSDSVHIGIVANLQKRKGHDEFIHMAALLAKDYDGLCFHIIGGDILEEPREPKLKQRLVRWV